MLFRRRRGRPANRNFCKRSYQPFGTEHFQNPPFRQTPGENSPPNALLERFPERELPRVKRRALFALHFSFSAAVSATAFFLRHHFSVRQPAFQPALSSISFFLDQLFPAVFPAFFRLRCSLVFWPGVSPVPSFSGVASMNRLFKRFQLA